MIFVVVVVVGGEIEVVVGVADLCLVFTDNLVIQSVYGF